MGLIYCDIPDLEKNNIKFGSQTGDKLLKNCVRYIREKLNTSSIYRVNGDEFAVICYNLSESDFMKKVKEFKRMNSRAELGISVGYVWTDHLPLDMDSLLKTDNELNRFLEHAYYDLESMLRSISQQNMTSYFFFGDMQKNLFYISDNLKEDFGFQSNIVPEFLTAWGNRIINEKSRALYMADQDSMLREKRTVHDLRYQVYDIKGKNI